MGNLTHITNDNFQSEVIDSDLPVIMDIWAPWCMPCKMIAPILEELGNDFEGQLKIVKLNMDEQPEIPSKFNITSIPTLLFFKNGENVYQHVGNTAKARIAQMIKDAFGIE